MLLREEIMVKRLLRYAKDQTQADHTIYHCIFVTKAEMTTKVKRIFLKL